LTSVAIDAAGASDKIREIVTGAARASLDATGAAAGSAASSAGGSVEIQLVGDERRITEQLIRMRHNPERISVVHSVAENPVRDAVRLAAEGTVEALVLTGPSGPAVAACRDLLTLLPGVPKAALSAVYPTALLHGAKGDPFTLLLDVGAALQADAGDLVTFAFLGATYARAISQNDSPRVALLAADDDLRIAPPFIAQAAARLARARGITFVGLIEAVDIPKGIADVVVADGFAGNTVIKLLDGVRELALDLAGYAQKQRLLWKIGVAMLSGVLSRIKNLTDWEQYGGAPLLGYPQVILRAHPNSDGRTIHNACRVAAKAVAADVPRGFAELAAQATSAAKPASQVPEDART
jgi:glycerol-3-phosphate acyltransferase PlsX